MRTIRMILLGGLFIFILSSGVKKIEKEPCLTVTPSELRLFVNQHTDPYTLPIIYTLNIPAGFIPSCARLIYKPYFQAIDHRLDLTPLVVSGRENLRQEKRLEALNAKQPEYPGAMHLVSEGDGMKIRLSETIPFEVWMTQAKLRADVILEACDRERHIEVLTLADGVIWFPQGPGPALVKYVKEETEVQKVVESSFLYPQGKYIFEKGYDGNARHMQKMMQWMDSLREDPAIELEKIVITGYSSPIGNLKYNQWLAEQRAFQMKQRFVGWWNLKPGLIEIQAAPVDWSVVRQIIVQDKRFPGRQSILQILTGNYTDNQRQFLLQKSPQYEYIRQSIFPELQKVTCRFFYKHKEEATKAEPL